MRVDNLLSTRDRMDLASPSLLPASALLFNGLESSQTRVSAEGYSSQDPAEFRSENLSKTPITINDAQLIVFANLDRSQR